MTDIYSASIRIRSHPEKRRFALEVYLRERLEEDSHLGWLNAKDLLEKYHKSNFGMSYTTMNDDIARVLEHVME